MKKQKQHIITDKQINNTIRALKLIFVQPFLEIFHGATTKKIPSEACMIFSTIMLISFIFKFDIYLARRLSIIWLYPTGLSYYIYHLFIAISGFYFWGVFQTCLQVKLINKLTRFFIDNNMKSPTGRMPFFIHDEPIDDWTREMRFRRNGYTEENFRNIKAHMESDLQIYIDDIKEDREKGTIDITYALKPMKKHFDFPSINSIKPGSYVVGLSRTKTIQCDFYDHPHALVAGATGGGKSAFLRQMITSLYIRNKDYKFIIMDPKRTEAHIFKNLPRIKIINEARDAAIKLKEISEGYLEDRKKLLYLNDCVNFKEYLEIPQELIKVPEGVDPSKHRSSFVILVDEAQDIFGRGIINKELADSAKLSANRIAAQGRALSIFIVVSTQRPDRFSIDPSMKANLVGKVCYKMKNLASSMTMLDNKKAVELPNVPGRAIWQGGRENVEIQTPFLSSDKARELLKPYYEEPKEKNKKADDAIKDLNPDIDLNESEGE